MTSVGIRARLTIWLTKPLVCSRGAFPVSAAMQEEDGLAGLGLLWMNPPPPHAAFVDRLEINIMGQGAGRNEGVVDRPRLGARRPPEVREALA